MPRIWRSFAVLRRISLATLAQRLRQPQDDKIGDIGVLRGDLADLPFDVEICRWYLAVQTV
jgi:hypothetical protein